MSASLSITAALLLGLLASSHCLLMCGGISAALGSATARGGDGRPQAQLLLGYQLGRIASYTLIGFLAGYLGHYVIGWLDIDAVRSALRIATGVVMLLSAFALLGWLRNPGVTVGRPIWRQLSKLGSRLLPVTSLPRALGFGMLWGWMPCGFVYNVVVVAALTADPRDSALTMLAFGLGTLPAMLATSWGGQQLSSWLARPSFRHAAASLLIGVAIVTMAGPWLIHAVPGLHASLPFDCELVHADSAD